MTPRRQLYCKQNSTTEVFTATIKQRSTEQIYQPLLIYSIYNTYNLFK